MFRFWFLILWVVNTEFDHKIHLALAVFNVRNISIYASWIVIPLIQYVVLTAILVPHWMWSVTLDMKLYKYWKSMILLSPSNQYLDVSVK